MRFRLAENDSFLGSVHEGVTGFVSGRLRSFHVDSAVGFGRVGKPLHGLAQDQTGLPFGWLRVYC